MLALVSHVVVVVRKSSCVSQVKRFVAVLRRSAGTIFSFDAVQVCHDAIDETVFGVKANESDNDPNTVRYFGIQQFIDVSVSEKVQQNIL